MTEHRDLWWEARQAMAKASPQVKAEGFDAVDFAVTTARDCAIAVDLNKYRKGVNLKALMDRGVNRFILRMGGPNAWVEGAWKYTEDPTWRPYMDELDGLGVAVDKQVIGYIIHNPFEPVSATMDGDTHVQLVNEWTSGGYMPGAFCVDHEVATCWRNNIQITCTAPNLVRSLNTVSDWLWKKFHRIVGVYTGTWFTNQYGKVEHQAYFDNINKPESLVGAGMQRPTWFAWLPNTALGNTTWNNAQDVIAQLPAPTGAQLGNLLNIGSYSLYTLWQFLFAFKTPELVISNPSGVDISVSRGTLAEFDAAWGLVTETTPPPPPPPPDPDPEPTDLTALTARVAALEAWQARVKAA